MRFTKKSFLSLLFFAICLYTNAQYTDVINSNKPGLSESPYSVGSGVYQFETNLFFRKLAIKPKFSEPQSLGIDLQFRTSFLSEKLELNVNLAYQQDDIVFNNFFTSTRTTNGLSDFSIAAKYLLFQQEFEDKSKEVRSWKRRYAFDKKRLIPSVALYARFNTDLLNDNHKIGKMTPTVGVLLQNDLSSQLNIITNFYYENIGSDYTAYNYIITSTINLSDRWSTFLEHQGIFKDLQNDFNFGTGLAYLFSRDLQINASGRYIVEGNAYGGYFTVGASYRINRHKDDYYEVDANGNKIKETPIQKYNKKQGGFFSRIFKKKDKSTRKRRRN